MRYARTPLVAGLILATCGLLGQPTFSVALEHGQPEPAGRHVLANGATVVLHPVPGVGQVAVEAFYEVGLVHEPAGMPQAAHLLEHLLCNAATAGYQAGESMAWLNGVGMANAETMPDWTHYDYAVPAGELERVLQIEAERLGSLVIDEAIIRAEGPRCAAEVGFVEGNPRAGMGKFAFCALAQAWRHGREVAHIRTGLEDYSPEAMEQFRRATYQPGKLTLVIVGDFDPEAALELARRHVGAVPPAEAADAIEPIDWSKAPKRSTVRWDSKVQAVCLAFPPPEDAVERAVLSLLGAVLQQRLSADPELQQMVDAVYTPNHLWPVGELPFFIYAAVKPGVELEQVEVALAERVAILAEHGGGIPPASLALYARQLSSARRRLAEPAVRQMAGALMQQGRSQEQALWLVLGQGAINLGVAERFLGDDPAALLAEIEGLTADRLGEIVRATLNEERMTVTRLTPGQPQP